jgi:hypothetical protein
MLSGKGEGEDTGKDEWKSSCLVLGANFFIPLLVFGLCAIDD